MDMVSCPRCGRRIPIARDGDRFTAICLQCEMVFDIKAQRMRVKECHEISDACRNCIRSGTGRCWWSEDRKSMVYEVEE